MKHLMTATAFNADESRTKDADGKDVDLLLETPLKSNMEKQLEQFKADAGRFNPAFLMISISTSAGNAVRRFYRYTFATGKQKAIGEEEFMTVMAHD